MIDFPKDLLYAKDHEWARLNEQRTIATIGITSFAVEQLGDITQVDLPSEGEQIARGNSFGSVESVKAVSDLYAPLSGKIIKVNTPLSDSPEYLNEEPYDEGWMLQIELSKPLELDDLMTPEAYMQHVAAEG